MQFFFLIFHILIKLCMYAWRYRGSNQMKIRAGWHQEGHLATKKLAPTFPWIDNWLNWIILKWKCHYDWTRNPKMEVSLVYAAGDAESLSFVVGATITEREIWQTMLQWSLPQRDDASVNLVSASLASVQWVLPHWGIIYHQLNMKSIIQYWSIKNKVSLVVWTCVPLMIHNR